MSYFAISVDSVLSSVKLVIFFSFGAWKVGDDLGVGYFSSFPSIFSCFDDLKVLMVFFSLLFSID